MRALTNRVMTPGTSLAIMLFALSMPVCGCKSIHPTEKPRKGSEAITNASVEIAPEIKRECQAEAQRVLGPHAKVLRCGELNSPGVPEVVAVIPASFPVSYEKRIAIRKLVILRRVSQRWNIVLTAERQIRNESGYVGLEYIDDYYTFYGYWLELSDETLNGAKAFFLDFVNIDNPDGSSEQTSTEIAWNVAAGRYQEWAYDQDPPGFHLEIKNPPHWKPGVKLPPANPR